ncbi:MAG: sulfite reductase flavoprotein subunit alpha, partial [Dokdonella sp.]
AEIALRVRENPGFHAPRDDRPLILIGNGSGLAGLRGLLKQRVNEQRRRNWLLFGERHAAQDFFHKSDIEIWQAQGWIEHLDLAFSRDQSERIYVQHLLQQQPERLQAWIDAGAVIMVCGSLAGMAQDVDATLRDLLGDATVTRLAAEGRYRRDVY